MNAAVLVAPGYSSALVLRFLSGFFPAGVYPPAMKMIATWCRDARGFAIGTILGALTVRKAVPCLLTVAYVGAGADGTLKRSESKAALDHQGGQQPGPSFAGAGGVELPLPATTRRGAEASAGVPAAGGCGS